MKHHRKIKAALFITVIFLFCFSSHSECAEEKLKVIVEKASIYLEPDLESKVIANVGKGTLLDYKGRPGAYRRWYYVYFSSDENKATFGGYIQSFCVEFTAATVLSKKEYSEKKKIYFSDPIDIRVIRNEAKVHVQPDFGSFVVRDMKIGVVLKAIGKEGTWYYIEFTVLKERYRISGYIHEHYAEELTEITDEHQTKEAEDKETETRLKVPVPDVSPDAVEKPLQKSEKTGLKEFRRDRNNHIEIGVSYFDPSGHSIKNIYGSRPEIAADLYLRIWKGLEIWGNGNFGWDKGELSYTKEETKLNMFSFGCGINYRLHKNNFSLYAGVCPVYFHISEKNPIGDISEGQLGILGKIGSCFYIIRNMFVSLHAGYSYAKESSTDIPVNIGGIELGSHIGLRF